MKKLHHALLSAAALIVFFSCTQNKQQVTTTDAESRTAVAAKTVAYEQYTPSIKSFGSIIYASKVDITPQAGGIVEEIYVQEGDFIDKGALMAKLRNIQLNIQLQQAETAVAEAEAALKLTRAAYLEGKLQVEARLLQIEKTTITAGDRKSVV